MKDSRVAIVKDVLTRLKTDELEVCQGNTYVSIKKSPKKWDRLELHDLFEKLVRKKKRNCEVCAVGAMFISMVCLFDSVAVDVMREEEESDPRLRLRLDEVYVHLSKYFRKDQLRQMENAFENWQGHPKIALAQICRNVVGNRGRFDAKKFFRESRPYAEEFDWNKFSKETGL